MSKVTFKNPKGNTLYYASVGFDWGAFWSLILIGLPFFVRKMNNFGIYAIAFNLIGSLALLSEMNSSKEDYLGVALTWGVFTLALSLYLGLKGGRLTARHYLEEGYKIHTTDKTLLDRGKEKWQLEE